MALAPIIENFRAEMYRYRLTRRDVCIRIGMHPNLLSLYLTGARPLTWWAQHNIGMGINEATGRRLIEVDDSTPIVRPRRGRPLGAKLPYRDLIPTQDRRRMPRRASQNRGKLSTK